MTMDSHPRLNLGPAFAELAATLSKLKAERGHAHQCLGCGRPTKTWRNLCWKDGKIGPCCVSCRRRVKPDRERTRWIKDLIKGGTL